MKYAVETVALIDQPQGYRHLFIACADKASADWHCNNFERPRGFDARVIEVTEDEWHAIHEGERNGFLPSNKLPPLEDSK